MSQVWVCGPGLDVITLQSTHGHGMRWDQVARAHPPVLVDMGTHGLPGDTHVHTPQPATMRISAAHRAALPAP